MAERSETQRVPPAAGPLTGSGAEADRRRADRAELERRESSASEQMPRVVVTRGRVIASLVFVVGIVAFLYLGLPKLVGFGASIKRLREGNAWWLAGAALLEVLVFLRLHRAVPSGLCSPQLADRLEGELPDHDGRAGGNPPVRGRRSRRHRADGMGAAPLRYGTAPGGLENGRRSWRCCTAST